IALPPGVVAAVPAQAPRLSAPSRRTAVLWFRGRFRDRDGIGVVLGDGWYAASVDTLPASDTRAVDGGQVPKRAAEPKNLPVAPVADPAARLITSVDMTATLGPGTGARKV